MNRQILIILLFSVFIGSLAAGLVMDLRGLSWSFIVIGLTVLFLSLFASALIRSGSKAIPCA